MEEEHWIEHFKLQDQQQKQATTSPGNWEIRKEEQDFEEWKRKENKHILFFDGASKGNPGLAGGGGVLVSPTGHPELSFAWGLGIETNNRAEALALWQGLNQAINHNVQDLVIIGDSRLIIQALILRNRVKNAKLHHILEKIQLLLGSLRTYKLYHVLRSLNASADAEANKGALSYWNLTNKWNHN
jgi:ribonuclease HI